MIALLLPSMALQAQVSGCTDPAASNYNSAASLNDGSCTYSQVTVTASQVALLSDTIQETSGLVYWNGYLWTHNDDTDPGLYAIDTADGRIARRIAITGALNHDWEELTQDSSYFYIGDFGNNAQGNRQDLVILRIAKTGLLAGQTSVTPDKIFFSYADQTSFAATGNNHTDFDCESFMATADSLYLFTKQWVSGKSRIYAVPKIPGTYIAQPQAEYDVDGLITGATYLPAKKTVVLTGYKISSPFFQPFVVLLYDYRGNSFFSGNKRKLQINPMYHQTEAIATRDGRHFFLSNEKLSQSGITIPAKLQKVDLSVYLDAYYRSLGIAAPVMRHDSVIFYPNPARDQVTARVHAKAKGKLDVGFYDASGRLVLVQNFELHAGENRVVMVLQKELPAGVYTVKLKWDDRVSWEKMVCY